jgi:hypothetical protein
MSIFRVRAAALLAAMLTLAAPALANAAAAARWQPVDLTFTATGIAKPFEVAFTGELNGPSGQHLVLPGFFDGGDQFKLRVSASEVGTWTVTTHAPSTPALDGKTITLDVTPNANPHIHGALQLDPRSKTALRWEDGAPYFLSGYECDWLWALGLASNDTAALGAFLDDLGGHGFNHVLLQAYAYDTSWRPGTTGPDDYGPPPRQAWPGPHASPDFTQFDLPYWQHYDAVIDALHQRGIVAHVILRVYNKQVNWPPNGSREDDAYYRWIVARYAAYPNVIWDLSKEAQHEPDLAYKQGRLSMIRALDGYARMRTVHDDAANYDAGAYDGLVELRTDQTHSAYHATILKERATGKWPVLNAEYGYEYGPGGPSDVTYAGSDSPAVMADRAWQIAMAGGVGAYYYTYTAWDVLRPGDLPKGEVAYQAFARFFAQVDFPALTPADALVTASGGTAYALAEVGREYVFYAPMTSELVVKLEAPDGPLAVRWWSPATGASFDDHPVGAGTVTLTPPSGWSGPIAVHLFAPSAVASDAGANGGAADAGLDDAASGDDAAAGGDGDDSDGEPGTRRAGAGAQGGCDIAATSPGRDPAGRDGASALQSRGVANLAGLAATLALVSRRRSRSPSRSAARATLARATSATPLWTFILTLTLALFGCGGNGDAHGRTSITGDDAATSSIDGAGEDGAASDAGVTTLPTSSGGDDAGAAEGGADGGPIGPNPSFCTDETPTVTPSGKGYSVLTTHYDLYAETTADEALVFGRLLEASSAAFSHWFSRPAPGHRLSVKYFATAAAFDAALAADGVSVGAETGGYYAPDNQTAYLSAQPNPYYSRVLLVHEATHQFHFLTRLVQPSIPFWYAEGHAEYLSRHDWDGRCVRLGVTSLLSWEDMPSVALAEPSIDVASIVSGATTARRDQAWAIFRYLDTGSLSSAFAAYRDAFDANMSPSFDALVAPAASLDAPLTAWLPSAQEPMKPIFTEWIHVGPSAVDVATPSVVSAAEVKSSAAAHLQFEFVPNDPTHWEVGALVEYVDASHFTAVLHRQDGHVRSFVAAGSAAWKDLGSAPVASAGNEVVSVDVAGSTATVRFDGTAFAVPVHAAHVGLSANDTAGHIVKLSFD